MKKNEYKISLTQLKDKNGNDIIGKNIEFTFNNHDDILEITSKIKNKKIINENDVLPFSVGLKLLSEVALENKSDELFKEFFPHLKEFILRIKKMD